ncbi:MAG: single-stranded DNA-binding protein [Ruminococcus sp.]|nr:single-stranded DNA-binding protein [Ruminococcus sp.]
MLLCYDIGDLAIGHCLSVRYREQYIIVSIAVDRSKRNISDTVENCLAFDENAKSVSSLYSKGGIITFVGSLRKAPDDTVVISVEELHFQNKFDVKVDVDSGEIF